jgi:TPR repeat protein
MSTAALKWFPVIALVLGCQAPGAFAQSAPTTADRLHANAVGSFRQARFPEAYGRFIKLADAGHAPSAELALWMYLHGPSLFGRDWDSTQDQLTAWAQLAQQPVPTMVAHVYPQTRVPVAGRTP